MPLATALPSFETVTLVHGSNNGGALFAQAILRAVTRSWCEGFTVSKPARRDPREEAEGKPSFSEERRTYFHPEKVQPGREESEVVAFREH
jgi:hypothetical protein